MRKSSTLLDWSILTTFYSNDAPEFVSQSNTLNVDYTSTCYEWRPEPGDVSLFALDGFSISRGSFLVFGIKLQPTLVVVHPEREQQRKQWVGRLRWVSIEIPTTKLEYQEHAQVDPSLSGRRRNSVYYNGPPNGEQQKLCKRRLEQHALDGDLVLELEYEAMCYFDPKIGRNVGQILVLSIRILLKSTECLWNMILKNGHRITCLVKTMNRNEESKRAQHNHIYLGRAQHICTNDEMKQRVMQWTSHVNQVHAIAFPGYTPRQSTQLDWEHQQEEIQDMQLIQLLQPEQPKQHLRGDLSHRNSVSMPHTYIPDHDDYCNPCQRLPLVFHKQDQMVFKFYNFKFTPPRCIEHTLKWRDFEAASKRETVLSPRTKSEKKKAWFSWILKKEKQKTKQDTDPLFVLERIMGNGLTLLVHFGHTEEDSCTVALNKIELVAKEYDKTLDFKSNKMVTV